MKNSTKISFDFENGILKAIAEKNGEVVYQSDDVFKELAEAFSAVLNEYECDEKAKRFSGKMICIDPKGLSYYTKGKIYSVVDGEYYDDSGETLIMMTNSPENETDADFMTVIED